MLETSSPLCRYRVTTFRDKTKVPLVLFSLFIPFIPSCSLFLGLCPSPSLRMEQRVKVKHAKPNAPFLADSSLVVHPSFPSRTIPSFQFSSVLLHAWSQLGPISYSIEVHLLYNRVHIKLRSTLMYPSVSPWHQLASTDSAFAALRADGSVIAWGDAKGAQNEMQQCFSSCYRK